jgi:hypothetical protein
MRLLVRSKVLPFFASLMFDGMAGLSFSWSTVLALDVFE